MDVIAILTIVALIVMGGFHFYWAIGGTIGLDKVLPTKDEQLLLNPGKFLTFCVGLVLISFAYIAYALQLYDTTSLVNSGFYIYSGLFIAIVFLLRFIGDFNAIGIFKKIKNTEFAIYDTKYFHHCV
jgi:hypothetical protein